MVDDNWKVIGHDPFLLKRSGELGTLFHSFFSNAWSGVSKVRHEGRLQLFGKAIFSESNSKVGNKLKDYLSSSPLTIFSHISELA